MKRFTKRLISIALSFILLLSGIVIVGAAESSNEDASEAMEILRLLEIIPDFYDYNVDMHAEVTRADFVDAVYKLIAAGEYTGEELYYYDVPATHWAYKAVTYLTEAEIVGGSGNNLFKPDDHIAQAEAYKILLSILGYGEFAEVNGGFPSGYISTARRCGISTGITSDPLTRGDMFVLLYNAMTANMYDPYSFSADYVYKKVADGETMLSVYRDIYYNEGILTDTDSTCINGDSVTEETTAVIGGTLYNTDVELKECLGEEIRFLYRYDKTLQEKTVIWAKKTGNTKTVTIEADGNTVFDSLNYSLSYTDDEGNTKTYILDKGIGVIYNGELVTEKLSEIFSKDRYKVKLVQNTSGVYDTAIVDAYFNIMIGTINSLDMTVYDKINPMTKLSLDKDLYDSYKLTMLGETEITFDDIVTGQVLTVYLSNNKKHLRAELSGKKSEGVLTNKRADEYYTVDNMEYRLAQGATDDGINVGDSVTLYLDSKGDIAYIGLKTSDKAAAFMLKYALVSNGLSNTLQVKLLRESGKVEVLSCADKVTIDAERVESADKMVSLLAPSGEFLPTLVLFKTNSKGEITEIDTPAVMPGEDNNTLQINIPYKESLVYKTSGIMGALSIMNNNTMIFAVPAKNMIASAEDDDFVVIKRGTIANDKILNAETYKSSEDVSFEQYVVLYGYDRFAYKNADSALPIVTEGVSTVLNADGTETECIYGYQGNNYVEYKADEELSFTETGIKEGCLVRVALNTENEVAKCQVLYDPDKASEYKTSTTVLNAGFRMVVGYASSISDTILRVSTDKGGADVQAFNVSSSPVVFYEADADRNKIRTGSVNDVMTYKNDKDNCSRVIVITSFMAPCLVIVYK